MNTMRTVSRSLVGLIAICWAGLAGAQNTPIPGIGYNENIVVGVGESFANAPITATMDNGTTPYGGNTWYAMGQNTTALATGLPMGTQFTVADATTGGDTFQFQGTDMNNAIFLAGNGSGPTTATYTLALAGTCSSLSFLAASGNGNGTIGVTLNYSDGSTVNESITTGDWFGNTPVAYNASGRILNLGLLTPGRWLGKVDAILAGGRSFRIGPCLITSAGIQFETSSWFSSNPHSVPWDRVRVDLANGDLIVSDREMPRTKIAMPFKTTNNAPCEKYSGAL